MSKQQLTVDEEMNRLVEKMADDFKFKLSRLFSKYQKKSLKEQAVQLRTSTQTTRKPQPRQSKNKNVVKKPNNRYRDRSDSESSNY
jgi:hypothetical protein